MTPIVFLMLLIGPAFCSDDLMTYRQSEGDFPRRNETCSTDTLNDHDGYVNSFAKEMNIESTNDSSTVTMTIRNNITYAVPEKVKSL